MRLPPSPELPSLPDAVALSTVLHTIVFNSVLHAVTLPSCTIVFVDIFTTVVILLLLRFIM